MSELEAIALVVGLVAAGAAVFFVVRGFLFRNVNQPVQVSKDVDFKKKLEEFQASKK